jgi:hypothetical protein
MILSLKSFNMKITGEYNVLEPILSHQERWARTR